MLCATDDTGPIFIGVNKLRLWRFTPRFLPIHTDPHIPEDTELPIEEDRQELDPGDGKFLIKHLFPLVGRSGRTSSNMGGIGICLKHFKVTPEFLPHGF